MKNITITLIALFTTINALAAIPVVKCSEFESKTFQLITKYEGWKPSVYTCPAGKQTIGWGFTSPEIISKRTITRKYADEKLLGYIRSINTYVTSTVDVALTENQRIALVSFVYNVGRGNFERSSLLRKLNKKDFSGAAQEFSKWTKSKGKTLSGLVSRRAEERSWFCKK